MAQLTHDLLLPRPLLDPESWLSAGLSPATRVRLSLDFALQVGGGARTSLQKIAQNFAVEWYLLDTPPAGFNNLDGDLVKWLKISQPGAQLFVSEAVSEALRARSISPWPSLVNVEMFKQVPADLKLRPWMNEIFAGSRLKFGELKLVSLSLKLDQNPRETAAPWSTLRYLPMLARAQSKAGNEFSQEFVDQIYRDWLRASVLLSPLEASRQAFNLSPDMRVDLNSTLETVQLDGELWLFARANNKLIERTIQREEALVIDTLREISGLSYRALVERTSQSAVDDLVQDGVLVEG